VQAYRLRKPTIDPACRLIPSPVQALPVVVPPSYATLLCADETSSAQGTICVLSLHLLTLRREDARKGRGAGGDHAHPQALLLPGRHRASVGGKVPVELRFWLPTLLLDMKHDATDRFMRDTIRCCYGTERFLQLYHTLHHG